MNLGFLTQPIHPAGRNPTETLAEDRAIFCLADELGYSEAYCGEHMTAMRENIANSLMFIASLADSTKNIKLGTGVHNLAFTHPLIVASNVAMVDHILKGRFLFGIGAGTTYSDAEALGILSQDRRAMFDEAIDHVIALWNGKPPYNLSGEYWNISTERTSWPELGLGEVMKPFQTPHPPILTGTGDARSKRVASFGKRGWNILSSDTLPASRLAEQWATFAGGCAEGGHKAERKNWRVVRSIFIADDDKTANAYGKASPASPYRFHFEEFHMKFVKGKMLDLFKADPSIPDEQVTLEYALDNCVITGSVNKVVDEILAVREAAGPFGTLLYAGKNWTDPGLSRRSMELMAERVMPAVNAAIGKEDWES